METEEVSGRFVVKSNILLYTGREGLETEEVSGRSVVKSNIEHVLQRFVSAWFSFLCFFGALVFLSILLLPNFVDCHDIILRRDYGGILVDLYIFRNRR